MNNNNIVIIDGNIQASISLSNFLEFQGFRTFEAYNKEDGEELIRSKDPRYILIDSILNGASKEIIKAFPKKIFILLYHDENEDLKAKNIKIKIKKPIDNEEVLRAVK
jgi:DNA-binding response OmpR family regulator